MKHLLRGAIVPALLLVLWELASRRGTILNTLSRPSDILLALLSSLRDGSILIATVQTFEAALLGVALAAVVGTSLRSARSGRCCLLVSTALLRCRGSCVTSLMFLALTAANT